MMNPLCKTALIAAIVLGLTRTSEAAAPAADAWADNHFAYRRPVDVNWNSTQADGREIAEAIFLSAGHVRPDGRDVYVTTDNGTAAPCRVLMVGPGDSVRVVFALTAGVQRYYIYFGDAQVAPPSSGPTNTQSPAQMQITSGLLLETRQWNHGLTNSAEALETSWQQSGPVIGQAMVDRPYVGGSPFGNQLNTISHYSGTFAAPLDGDYMFAAGAVNRGGLFIDGLPVVYAPDLPGNTRYHTTLPLSRGRHLFDFYQVYDKGTAAITVGWQRPGARKLAVMGRDAFGVVSYGIPGMMQERGKRFVADFSVEYLGECTAGAEYTQRYRFTAASAANDGQTADRNSVRWDFGDGLSGTGAVVEHVFLGAGIYPVHVAIASGELNGEQTSRLAVSRDWGHPASPLVDSPDLQSNIVAQYNVADIPIQWLPTAAMLDLQSENTQGMLDVAARLASEKTHPAASKALDVLQQITRKLITTNAADKILAVWDMARADSDLQPRAAVFGAQMLMWWKGDFAKAEKLLEGPAVKWHGDRALQCAYAEALILNQKTDQGRQILLGLPIKDELRRRVAFSGAMARTVEFYIIQKDWESGEDAWDKWQFRCPDAFLEGYSVLLRARLIALRDAGVAAKLAEAFATAFPQSPYSPSLLELAADTLAKSDPAKAAQLRQTLKEKYPEDPLSQQ